MTVFGDPNNFALMAESVRSWNESPGAGNGLFHFVVDGRIFPRRTRVSALSADIGALSPGNALVDLPENSEITDVSAVDAFTLLLNGMLPYILLHEEEIPDDFETDYTYQASTCTLEDENCFAFALRVGEHVRVLAGEVERDASGDTSRVVDVAEAYIHRDELSAIIGSVRLALQMAEL